MNELVTVKNMLVSYISQEYLAAITRLDAFSKSSSEDIIFDWKLM